MKTNKKMIITSVIIAIIGLVLIVGGSYALFNYSKEGTTDNVVTTGKITFRYDEDSINGIDLKNAMPILDMRGSELTGEGEYFDFTISTEGTDQIIAYNVELETTEDSTLDPSVVKVYLTQLVNGVESVVYTSIDNGIIRNYNEYPNNAEQTAIVLLEDVFLKSSEQKEHKYRLRVWIDKDTDFSPLKNEDGTYQEDENGNYIYPYNNQTLKVRVNVEATANPHINEGIGDIAVAENCNRNNYCTAGSSVTLPDGSTWKNASWYSSYDGDETITLISDNYIDINGNFIEKPINQSLAGLQTDEERISHYLETFTNKIKTSLQDENITVQLPSAELLEIDFFNSKYNDSYYLDRYEHYNGIYIMSDYHSTGNGFNSTTGTSYTHYYYWFMNNYKLVPNNSTGYYIDIDGDGIKENYQYSSLIKPVITISKDYLPE